MATLGFRAYDFAVFKIGGFSERMEEIYRLVRPKLVRLGAELAPELARRLGMEFFPHVARHARRTVNPPPETWAAFGPSPRGYKRYGYLTLAISRAGLHARAVVKPEADRRAEMARAIRTGAPQLARAFRGTRIARYDKWNFSAVPPAVAADEDFFASLARGLEGRTGVMDAGFGWNVSDSLGLDRAELLDAWRELEPLYRILRAAS
jgi:uncharacterized protein YktB (UPF0637 family)